MRGNLTRKHKLNERKDDILPQHVGEGPLLQIIRTICLELKEEESGSGRR